MVKYARHMVRLSEGDEVKVRGPLGRDIARVLYEEMTPAIQIAGVKFAVYYRRARQIRFITRTALQFETRAVLIDGVWREARLRACRVDGFPMMGLLLLQEGLIPLPT